LRKDDKMKLQYFICGFLLAVGYLLQNNFAAGQEKTLSEADCESYIEIHGSSNINQFQLINHNPKIIRHSGGDEMNQGYQRVEIPADQFEGNNNRMRNDFLEMINASEYPFIIMAIEPRSLAECRKIKGMSDFKTIITIAGVSQNYVVPCAIYACENSGYVLKGNLEVKLTDFGIDPPRKFFGIVKVNNEVFIDYVFRFQTDDDIFRSDITPGTVVYFTDLTD
jgi:hypothetical protein